MFVGVTPTLHCWVIFDDPTLSTLKIFS